MTTDRAIRLLNDAQRELDLATMRLVRRGRIDMEIVCRAKQSIDTLVEEFTEKVAP